jgi:hemolysin activation/secretion protein
LKGHSSRLELEDSDNKKEEGILSSRTFGKYAFSCCLAIACALGNTVWAQGLGGGSIFETRPSERRPTVPPYEKPAPPVEVPEKPPIEQKGLPGAIRVFVREFRFTGNTVIPTEELKKVAAPFENRYVTNNDLEELRKRLTLLYINKGYINSGAIIPDQKVVNETIEIRIIEGELSRIEIEGTKHFNPKYFTSRLQLGAGPPLNVRNVESELQILLQDPLIEQIKAQLVPGDKPGEAVLKTDVKEYPPWDFGLVLDNKIPPSLGEERLLTQGAVYNLARRGDALLMQLEEAQGIKNDLKLRYRVPLTPKDLALNFYYENGRADVVEQPFDELDIETKLQQYGIQIGQPVIRKPNQTFTLAGLFEHTDTETTWLGGEPVSFSPGVPDDGKATVSVLRFVQDYVGRTANQVLSFRSTISLGIDCCGATINDAVGVPDSQFTSWIPQFQWVRRFGKRGQQVYFRFDGQMSSAGLLPVEKFTVGGLDSVRGYRTNQLVRDQGYTASFQYQLPLFSNPVGKRNLQFAAFVDTGAAKDKNGPNLDPSSLTGVGVGFIWTPSPKFQMEFYYADPLDDAPEGGSYSWQDAAYYFRIVSYPFHKRFRGTAF